MKKMFKAVLAGALFALGMQFALAADIGAQVAVGGGVAAFNNVAVSGVSGSFGAGLTGTGSQSQTFAAGNQSYGNSQMTLGNTGSVTFTQSGTNTNAGNGNNGWQNQQSQVNQSATTFEVAAQSGSQNFGSSIQSGVSFGGTQYGNSTAAGAGAATQTGFSGLIGVGGSGFASF